MVIGKKAKSILDQLQGSDEKDKPTGRAKPPRVIQTSRATAAGEAMDPGRNRPQSKRILSVDPAICRVWEFHNRDYGLLNEDRCADLIEGFQERGEQEFPAIVRELSEPEGEVRYEIICGARRHWVANYLRWQYKIEVQDLSDADAFVLSDIENRARKDLSDYERACDYAQALENGFYPDQAALAQKLQKTPAWLSQYLTLAKLPPEVIEAYSSQLKIPINHGVKLKPYLENRAARTRVIKAALKLKGTDTRATDVLQRLISAGKQTAKSQQVKKQGPLGVIRNDEGAAVVTVSRKGRRDLRFDVNTLNAGDSDVLLKALESAVEAYFEVD